MLNAYLLKINLCFRKGLQVPKYYNHTLQGFFYKNMDELLAKFYHEQGYILGNRKFKLFTFSKIFGKLKGENGNHLLYSPPSIHIYFSTPTERTLKSVIRETIRKTYLTLGQETVKLCGIDVIEVKLEKEIKVLCLSPIVIYKTKPGSKRHIYLSPFYDDFYKLLQDNLLKKYQLVYGKKYEGELEIMPVKVKEEYKRKVLFKTTLIEAWEGIYKLSGEEDILKVAIECGLGVKNSAGFGCIIKLGSGDADRSKELG